MTVPLTFVGVFYLLAGLGLLLLLVKPLQHPDKPSTEGFTLTLSAAATNTVIEGINLLDPDAGLSLAIWYGRVFGGAAATAGWLLLAVGFTTGHAPSRRIRAVVYGYLSVLGLVMVADTTFASTSIFVGQTELWAGLVVGVTPEWAFWVNAAVSYCFLLSGTVLLVLETVRTTGLRRRQSALLALAAVPPGIANVLVVSGVVSVVYDITSLGHAMAILAFTWALYRMSVLDFELVGRRTAMEQMDDAVVTLDGANHVVDANASARVLFDLDEASYLGTHITGCLPSRVVTPLERFEDVDEVNTQVDIRADGGERTFSLSTSPVRGSDRPDGRVMVLRDVTPLKRREEELKSREEELDLLRQVFSRVLRHNLRNDLTVIHGSAYDLADQLDAPQTAQAKLICEASEDLLAVSRKARRIERIIDAEDGALERDLRAVATAAATSVEEQYSGATVTVGGLDSCVVRCNHELEAAVENLIENGVVHAETPTPTVRVEICEDDGGPQLTVADDGPGIEAEEVAVLESATETQLSHGSGIGLWLVKWVIDNSPAELAFESDSDGTEVTIRFDERWDQPD